MRPFVLICTLALIPMSAAATESAAVPDDAPVSSDIRYGVSAGAVEVSTAPHATHVGAYGIAGGYAIIPLGADALIPAVSFEYSPDTSAWGGVLTLTYDTPLASAPLGIDVTAILLSDLVGSDVSLAALYGGAGLGATWFMDDHWSCSAAVNIYHGVNIMAAPGWTAGPILFFGYAF